MTGLTRLIATMVGLTGCLLVSLGVAGPAVAAARPVRDCTAASGATVIVDFASWGGPMLRACGSTPTTGWRLLNQGGWTTSGDEHDGPGFICRIGYAGFQHGTQYPTPAQQPCVDTPPANAYWSYWLAAPGQNTWQYSQQGAPGYQPQPGSISLWIFGGTSVSGSSGSAVPTFSPATLRRAAATGSAANLKLVSAPPATGTSTSSPGSAAPTALVIVLVAGISLVGAGATWRRRRAARLVR